MVKQTLASLALILACSTSQAGENSSSVPTVSLHSPGVPMVSLHSPAVPTVSLHSPPKLPVVSLHSPDSSSIGQVVKQTSASNMKLGYMLPLLGLGGLIGFRLWRSKP